jgi:hypothetical protein
LKDLPTPKMDDFYTFNTQRYRAKIKKNPIVFF